MPIRRARKEAKQPFQDITDQFTTLSDTLPTTFPSLNIPTPKPKRRVRAPGGTLGAKLRAARNPGPGIPSSLPPSSPPSASSRLPWDENEHDENAHPLDILTSDNPADDELPNFEFQFDLENAPEGEGDDPIADAPEEWAQDEDEPALDPANMSDPFGFFAVEKQLKADRAANPATGTGATVRARYRGAPPPAIDTTVPDPPAREGLVTPPTPHKRVDKRRAVASPSQSSDGFFNPNTSSMPSTPSPAKPASSKIERRTVADGNASNSPGEGDETMEVEPTVTKTRTSRRLAKKPRSSGSPPTAARNSHTPLVKRPKRQAASIQKPTEKPGASHKGNIPEPKKKKGMTAGTRKKPASSGRQTKGKGKSKEDADDSDAEKQEVRANFNYYVLVP